MSFKERKALFEEFHLTNPHIYDELVDMAREAKARQYGKLGIRMFWEVLRWNQLIKTELPDEDGYKLNNIFPSFYARLIMHEEPDLEGVFEVRGNSWLNNQKESDPIMKKEDLKEFTIDARVAGPTREVQFTTGDVVVTSPALIIKGITAADAWQILLILDQGLFNKGDKELEEEEAADAKAEAPPPPPPLPEAPKKKRKSKAQKKAEEKAAAEEEEEDEEPVHNSDASQDKPDAEDPEEEDEEEDEEEEEVSPAQAKLDAERMKTKKAVEKKMDEVAAKKAETIAKADAKAAAKKTKKVGGIDLTQFKSASGLRELVGDFKEAGVESKDEVIEYCTELQGMGLKCLKGVNIERRVANLWAMVA